MPRRPEDTRQLALGDDAVGLVRSLRFARSQDEAWAAHYALVHLEAAAVEPLIDFLSDDPTKRGQRAWWTLLRIGEPAAAGLARCLRSSPTAEVRAAAAWVLGHVGGPDADRHLVRALDDPDDIVRLPAVLMAGFRQCRPAVPSVLRILTRGEHRDQAAPHPDQLVLPLIGVETFGEALDAYPGDVGTEGGAATSYPTAQGAAFEALASAHERGFGDDAADFFAAGGTALPPDDERAWESSDDFTPVWVISPWCYWSSDDVREAAAMTLGRIGDPRAVPALVDLVDDEGEPVMLRRLGIEALGQIGDERGFDAVYEALRDDELLDEALNALGGFTDRRALRPLVTAAFADGVERIDAVSGLSVYENSATLPYLVRLATDDDDYVAGQALRGLARIGSQTALEAVTARLTDTDPNTRRQAAAALMWAQRRRGDARAGRGDTIWHP